VVEVALWGDCDRAAVSPLITADNSSAISTGYSNTEPRAASIAGPGERRRLCARRSVDAIMRRMSKSTISVRVRAGAHREEVAGVLDGVLLVRVAAPAHEGRANRALCRLLAERLGVAPSRVAIVRGRRSREKLVEIDGIDQATVDRSLGLGIAPSR
jgi:uncharacterized protein (TIGR00251 family)